MFGKCAEDDYGVLVRTETGESMIAEQPELKGFGSTMIARSITYQLGGSIDDDGNRWAWL